MAPPSSKRGMKNIIGVELDIQQNENDLALKLNIEPKLALCVPAWCLTVENFKKYLIERLFDEDLVPAIRLYLGDTIRELPDFTSVDVFTAFKGHKIRVVLGEKQFSWSEPTYSHSSTLRKRVVRFEDEDKGDDDHGDADGDKPQDSKGTDHGDANGDKPQDPERTDHGDANGDKPQDPEGTDHGDADGDKPQDPEGTTSSGNLTVAVSTPVSPSTPLQDSTPEFVQELDSESAPGFSPFSSFNEELFNVVSQQNESGETITLHALADEGNGDETNMAANFSFSSSIGDLILPLAESTTLETSDLSEKENVTTQISEADEIVESYLNLQNLEDEVSVTTNDTDLTLSPARRGSKRNISEVALSPLPVFKGNSDERGGPKPKKKKRHSRASLPLIQLPTLVETGEGQIFNESETSEEEDLPRWRSNAELPKFTIKSSPPAEIQIQSLENSKTFDALAPQSYAGTPFSLPDPNIQEFSPATTFGGPQPRTTRRSSARAAATRGSEMNTVGYKSE